MTDLSMLSRLQDVVQEEVLILAEPGTVWFGFKDTASLWLDLCLQLNFLFFVFFNRKRGSADLETVSM